MKANTKIVFKMFDTDSKVSSNPVCRQSVTDVTGLKNEKYDTANYATTEPAGFYLDGSYKILEDILPVGLYSNSLSEKDGRLSEPVVLNIGFDTVVASSGITLYFPDGDYPSRLKIKWRMDEELLQEKMFFPDNAKCFCQGKVEKYNNIEITFYETAMPGHYIKLCGIDYGQTIVFTQEKIIQSNVIQQIDLLCDEISINTLEFTVEDKDRLFSAVSDNSVFFAAQENQKVIVYTVIGGQEKQIGTFYLEDIIGSGITATFKAQDLIGVLESESNIADTYFDVDFATYCSVILDGYEYIIDDSLKSLAVKGYLKSCSRREALQQACFAVGAVVDTRGEGKIRIYPLTEKPSQLLTASQIYAGGKIENIKPYNRILITAHNYTQSGEDTPQVVSRILNEKVKSVVSIENAVFINSSNVERVLDRLERYYQQQVLYTVSLPLNNYLSLGDVLMAYIQKSYIKGNLHSVETNLSGGLTAEIKIRGYVFNHINSSYTGEIFVGERSVI